MLLKYLTVRTERLNQLSKNIVIINKEIIMIKYVFLLTLFSLFLAQSTYANTMDALHLSGTYHCSGHDARDGGYQNATVRLILNAKQSDFTANYGAYGFTLTLEDGAKYVGEAAASGNSLAIYFENSASTTIGRSDRGVGIAMVTHDKNTDGKATTVFHKFYYEPKYKGGNNGTETCVKVNE